MTLVERVAGAEPPWGEWRPLHAVAVNGVELHYLEAGTGAAVILLHGGLGDLGSWTSQIPALADRHRVIAYSRRYSHPNRNGAIQRAAFAERVSVDIDDLLALKRSLGIGPAHLIGTSYGALVALAAALRAPADVASLVLSDPPLHRWVCASDAGNRLFTAFLEAWNAAGQALEAGLSRHALQLLVDSMWGRGTFERWSPARIAAAVRNASAMHALTCSYEPFPEFERPAVAELTIPTLLVQGAQTSPLHRSVMDELAGVMRGARRVEVSFAGHASPSEAPGEFNTAVVSFLDSLAHATGRALARTGKPR